MTKTIRKVAVIGAGTMGSGIAAQVANAGIPVVLLDIRENAAAEAIARMKAAHPARDPFNANFMTPANARLVTPGTMANDIEKIADADLIIEAVFERLDIKEDTFRLIEKHARPDALITSNTSTITIDDLVKNMSPAFRARFMNTHFFNPPRFMRLLEVITGPETAPETLESVRAFGDRQLGKRVIQAKDAPGFIANRIGVYMMERARTEAAAQGLGLEDVDAILSRPFDFPKLGVFKLADAVGLDVLSSVGKNLNKALPEGDDFNRIYSPEFVAAMVGQKRLGKKTGAGFYRTNPETGIKEALSLESGEYRPAKKSACAKLNIKKDFGSFSAFFESDHPAARYAWPVLRDTLCYVLDHAQEMAYDINAVDDAMRVGYNWKYGPFELVDRIGGKWFAERLRAEGRAVPELLAKAGENPFYGVTENKPAAMGFDGTHRPVAHDDGILRLSDLKRGTKPLLSHVSANLWDIGDGVVCFEFTSPQNSMDPSILHVLNESIKLVESSPDRFKAMVIYNEGEHFSVGANLKLVDIFTKASGPAPFSALLPAKKQKLAARLDRAYNALGGRFVSQKLQTKTDHFVQDMIYSGQAVFQALRRANFPVIGAPRGYAFGGGCEILLHCDAIQAGAESNLGLVEVGVGLIPGWGGCARMLERAANAPDKFKGPMLPFIKAALAISNPVEAISTSAQDARRKLWLRPGDGISMNSDRILTDAKAKALALAPGYAPPQPAILSLTGAPGKATLRMNADALYFKGGDPNKGGVNAVDVAVIDHLAHILSGGDSIDLEDIPAHLAKQHEAAHAIAATRPDGKIGVSPTLAITETRILQLEREAFMALFRTKATQERIAHMMGTGKPLREAQLNPAPTPAEIRAGLLPVTLPRRAPDGKPLTGADAERLQTMANITARVYKLGKKFGLT